MVNAATPVLMPWIDRVDAVLVAGLPGQEGGHAVAAALLGTSNPPAGSSPPSLPPTAPTPAWSVTPVDGDAASTPRARHRVPRPRRGQAPAPALWFGTAWATRSWDYADARVTEGAGGGDGGAGSRPRR